MIRPPNQMGAFEFVAIAALRVAQLSRGCRPRVDGEHTTAVFAQLEVAEGKVARTVTPAIVPLGPIVSS
jgi:DNA-directed RNA polymerase subunit K/omega